MESRTLLYSNEKIGEDVEEIRLSKSRLMTMSRPGKDPVQKCHSDPGAAGSSYSPSKQISRRQVPCIPSSPNTRKCVLTLDGYSYVIGE